MFLQASDYSTLVSVKIKLVIYFFFIGMSSGRSRKAAFVRAQFFNRAAQ